MVETLMKTLVFCTAFAEHRAVWDWRHSWWLKAIRASDLLYDQILIVDDGSPELPNWPDVRVVRQAEAETPESLRSLASVLLYSHTHRLGRHSVFDFPGWHRSFAFACLYAEAHGFEKVIHIESDAFLISQRITDYFNLAADGWATVWNPKYTFPEIAIQVVAGREMASLTAFARKSYDGLRGRKHEISLPYTHVETRFIGDRYGEAEGVIPQYADFSAQSLINQSRDYYWWIGTAGPRSGGTLRTAPQPPTYRYSPPFDDGVLLGDWSHPEPGIRWATHFDSRILLPPVNRMVDHRLELAIRPCTVPGRLDAQRLMVIVNDLIASEVLLYRSTVLGVDIPAAALSLERRTCIRLVHPDAAAPADLDPSAVDERKLSVGLTGLALIPTAYRRAAPPRRITPWRRLRNR